MKPGRDLQVAPGAERGRLFAVTGEEMRRLDALTIENGTPGDVLMERAGELAAEVLRERFANELRRGVVVVAGKGNNGGDAFVVARHLRRRRVPVAVFLAAAPERLRGDARKNLLRWKRMRGPLHELAPGGTAALADAAGHAGVLVDGLFGTGLRGEIDESSRAIVETLNASPAPILALDVPSGLDADRGVALGAAVQATMTVTFGFPKLGLLRASRSRIRRRGDRRGHRPRPARARQRHASGVSADPGLGRGGACRGGRVTATREPTGTC